MNLAPTPGQTVGPFFSFALVRDGYADLVSPEHPHAITLHGRVLDGAGEPVPDALVELTQGGDQGWGRAPTDDEGRYAFTTLSPIGSFFAITVFARGLLDRLFTRAYLPDAVDEAFLAGGRQGPSEDTGRHGGRARLRLRHPAAGRRRDRLPRLSARLNS